MNLTICGKLLNKFPKIFACGQQKSLRNHVSRALLDTPCKAGARSTLSILDHFLSMNFRIHDSRPAHVTWRAVGGPWIALSFRWGTAWSVRKHFFQVLKKNAPNRLQKRVRNGSPSMPVLSLKARFWRFCFSFFQIRENSCLKTPSVLSNVHPPIYQSQKSIISRTTNERTTNISDLAV